MSENTVSQGQPTRVANTITDTRTEATGSVADGRAIWGPATDGELDAWARGYLAGWNQGYADGCADE